MLEHVPPRPGPRFAARDLTAPWRHVDGILLGAVSVIAVMGAFMVYCATRLRRRRSPT